jgi:4-amino-4-deoxy-L-arabinose transferase-like glycosyltransferase
VTRRDRLIIPILVIFILLGAVYSIVVPPFEASDELWHYPMVKYIADHWALPVQDPANVGPWRQEGSQPPLYYALSAAATFWIDTGDMETVRHLNPQVDGGVATPDGNINLVVHRPEREAFPWQGTVLAVHLIRFLSVLMGATSVYLTYRIVRQVVPRTPALALGAAAIHAFTPMFIFISGSVNNDNLVVPLSSLALLMLIHLIQRPVSESIPWVRYLVLGVILGLAALTKTSSLALTVLTALVVTVRAVRRRSWAEFFAGGVATLVPLLAISGWWFARNLRLYGDLTGFSAFFEILGTRAVPADLAQLWRERYSFLAGYWGNFGGLNVPMPAWIYTLLNTLAAVSGLGLLAILFRAVIAPHLVGRWPGVDRLGLDFHVHPWSFLLALLWGLGIFIPWLGWARVTWSSQGRLVFPAISVWSFLLALGWVGWLPHRWGRWAVAGFAALLLVLSVMAPFVWIQPAYALPEPLTDAQVATIPHRLDVEFGDTVRLLGYDLQVDAVQPGDQVPVTLYWEALAPADRDYAVFVHLLGEGELLVSQRDTFPGLGQLSTTWLAPGFRWADRTVLQVPATAYAPDVTQFQVGLFHIPTDERLPAVGSNGAPLGHAVRFGRMTITPRAGEVPNPIDVNFGDRMRLVGYAIDERMVHPGGAITLTLHWDATGSMTTDYTVSAQLIDPDQRKAAQQDSWPPVPTSAWEPGDRVVDERQLAIHPDAAPGVYDVRIVVYSAGEEGLELLPIVSQGGEQLADHVVLTRVRVTP